MTNSNTIELTINDFERLVSVARYAVVVAFVLFVILLFHMLVDIFFHTVQ